MPNPDSWFELLDSIERRFTRPFGIVAFWWGLLWLTGSLELEASDSLLSGGRLLSGLEDLKGKLGPVGVEAEVWHVVLVSAVAFVWLFDRLTTAVWFFVPGKLAWSHADFWRANKSWFELVRLRQVLGLGESLTLSEVESQVQLTMEELRTKFAESASQAFSQNERRLLRWCALYAGLWTPVAITLITLVVSPLLGQADIFQARGLIVTLAVLLAVLIVVKVRVEVLVEHGASNRSFFVLRALDKNYGEHGIREAGIDLDAAERHLVRKLTGGIPGLPYGRVWLLHWLRQVPGFRRVGSYPWRSTMELKRLFPEEILPDGKIRKTTDWAQWTQPSGLSQWTVARVLWWLVKAGFVRNGGALTGGYFPFREVFAARRPPALERR